MATNRKSHIALLILSFIILLTACSSNEVNDGENGKIHLSTTKCELKQGTDTLIALIADKGTTVQSENPHIAEASISWADESSKEAKLKITAKKKGNTTIVITSADISEKAMIDVTVNKTEYLRIHANKTKVNIFDKVIFSIYNREDGSFHYEGNVWDEISDSVVWSVKGLSGSFKVFYTNNNSSKFFQEWTHTFKRPGKYETYLKTYKGGQVVFCDTLNMEIDNEKDFLMYNWSAGGSNSWTPYTDVLNPSIVPMSVETNIGGTRCAFIRFFDEELNKNYKLYYNYLTDIYGKPDYSGFLDGLEGVNHHIYEGFEKYFVNHDNAPHPCYIWITPKASIAILKGENDGNTPDYPLGYFIYAEPRK